MLHDTLMEAQATLEIQGRTEGYERFTTTQLRADKSFGFGQRYESVKIMRGCVPLVSAEVRRYLDTASNGGRGRTPKALAILTRFDPDQLAYAALNGVFNGVAKLHPTQKVGLFIGHMLEAELLAAHMRDKLGAKRFDSVAHEVKKQGTARGRRKALGALAKRNDATMAEWTNDLRVKVAEPLINAVLLALPSMFEQVSHGPKGKMANYVVLTDEGAKQLADLREAAAWMQPLHKPMVVKPRDWNAYDTGCYYDERVARTVTMVRTYNPDHRRQIKAAIKSGAMRYCIEALNTIQSTAWAINRPIVDLVRWAWETNVDIEGFPSKVMPDLPAKLPDDQWEQMSVQQRKGHKLTIAGLRAKRLSIQADTAIMLRDLSTAEEMARYERFYLPHNLDFRGRVYPVPHFSHQRADHIKAMFMFAEGKPLGPYGGGWLMVHIANTGDFGKISKSSFEERIQWVTDNEERLLRWAQDPKGTVAEWSQADSPFMFLAAVMEYARWRSSGFDEGFVSHLSIALDGSNSGLQHYAAALRSGNEAALVSLTNADQPADVYQVVADKVLAWTKAEATTGDEVAKIVLANGVGRNLVKRNVMTFAYSSEQFGFRDQHLMDTMRPFKAKVLMGQLDKHPYAIEREDGTSDDGWAASGYIAQKVWKGVTEVVTKATEGMRFFKDVAGILAHERKPLCWTTPIGLPVMHKYTEWSSKTVEMFLYDRSVPVVDKGKADKVVTREGEDRVLRQVRTLVRVSPENRICKDKARSACAPNIIHSMDGSHLMLTVLAAADEGITDFALIHDSFGTHAGATEDFFRIIREAFVEMYEAYDPFEEIYQSAYGALSEAGRAKLPQPPTKGDFELREVLEARYAFA